MSEFKVVLNDLDQLRRSLAGGAASYEQIIPSVNPPPVDGGDGNLNSVLQALTETFAVGHAAVVDSLEGRAAKVKSARDTFDRVDSGAYFQWDGTRSLYDDMVPEEDRPK
ncbi:DUF6317 family protein [Mycolicibacillus koreensis]|uniref:DUF6317 family protein n=1 Tax=Mycolicibacillus koreensis TaxID=1069220 RepID=UPI0010559E5E|nr:DUF6317 family protein [Mycolicibacillus koreensis]